MSYRFVQNPAPVLLQKLARFPPELVPRRYLARGNYFSFSGGKSPFSRLVYPIPPEGGLGVHVTVDLGGQCKFGPDVEWLPEDAEHPIARSACTARGPAQAIDPVFGETKRSI